MCIYRTALTVIVAGLALAQPAAADDKRACAGPEPDAAIRACTGLINAAARPSPEVAALYTSRGAAHASKKDYDAAIADYTKAIEISPKYAKAYDQRGVAYTQKGDYQRAVADVTMAVELAPKKTTSLVTPAAATAAPAPSAAAPRKSAPVPKRRVSRGPYGDYYYYNDKPTWAGPLFRGEP